MCQPSAARDGSAVAGETRGKVEKSMGEGGEMGPFKGLRGKSSRRGFTSAIYRALGNAAVRGCVPCAGPAARLERQGWQHQMSVWSGHGREDIAAGWLGRTG